MKKLNHRAKIIEANYGKVDVNQLVNTGLFKMDVAQTGYGWLQDLHAMTVREVNGKNVVTPKPETEEYNVQSFIYQRQRPFHPRRLFALLYDKFILQLEQPEDEDDDDDEEASDEEGEAQGDIEMADFEDSETQSVASSDDSEKEGSSYSTGTSNSTARTVPSPRPSKKQKPNSTVAKNDAADSDDYVAVDPLDMPPNEEILANKRLHPTLSRLFRSKGEFFLATRPHRAGDWSQAGAMLTMTGGRPWFCTLPSEEYTTGDPEVDALVQHDIAKGGEWGDRRQELVFIGEGLDTADLQAMLDECLLTESEFADWERTMRDPAHGDDINNLKESLRDLFEDGFPDWAGEPGDEEDEDLHAGHSHTHSKIGLRSIKEVFEEVS